MTCKRKPLIASFQVREGSSDEKALQEVWERNTYQKKGVVVEPGDRWLDAGANIGGFSVLAALKGAHVIALEPEPENAKLCRANAILNSVQVDLREAALGVEEGVATLNVCEHPLGLRRHSFFKKKKHSKAISVKTYSLNGLNVDCVKLNIEGAEHEILEKASFESVRKLVAEWSFDIDPSIPRLRKVVARLEGLGFSVALRNRLPEEAVWAFWPPSNFLYAVRDPLRQPSLPTF